MADLLREQRDESAAARITEVEAELNSRVAGAEQETERQEREMERRVREEVKKWKNEIRKEAKREEEETDRSR